VFRSERKLRLKIAHAVLQAVALVISAVGLKAVFDSHNLAADPHANMYTLHSWIGLATIVLFGVQVGTRSSLVFWWQVLTVLFVSARYTVPQNRKPSVIAGRILSLFYNIAFFSVLLFLLCFL